MGSTVLVIEDNDDVREQLATILSLEGFCVRKAANGRRGLEMVHQQMPDLVLCDLTMPDLDGWQTLASLRADPATVSLPFLCLSARTDRRDLRRAMEAGADDFITKPYTSLEILTAIRAALDRVARSARLSVTRVEQLHLDLSAALPRELRVPLDALLEHSGSLATSACDLSIDQIGQASRDVAATGQHLCRLTENFLLYAQTTFLSAEGDDGVIPPGPEADPVDVVIRQIAEKMAKEHGRETDLHLDLHTGPLPIGEAYLTRLIEELLANAFVFSEQGTPVRVECRTSGTDTRVCVVDHGRGMNATDSGVLTGSPVGSETAGSGLGLSIVTHITELANGRLTIDSRSGEGTTAIVLLPRCEKMVSETETPSAGDTCKDTRDGASGVTSGGAAGSRSGSILVIEDNPDICEETAAILEFEGFSVRRAANGREGLDLIEEECPDLIISDLMMPVLDGYETLEAVRAELRDSVVPFVCLTARADRRDLRRAMDLGADDFLTKPFGVDELLAAVRAALEKRDRAEARGEARVQNLRERLEAVLPHELRTPLHCIVGFADMLLDPQGVPDVAEVADIAARIHSAALRLQALMENFILTEQLHGERPIAVCDGATASVAEVVRAAANGIASGRDRISDITLDLEESFTPLSQAYLAKVVEELVDNALKFSAPGSAVTVTNRKSRNETVVRVEDRGCGISKHLLNTFDHFVHFDKSMFEKQGLGLGLMIARRIVELAGGKMTIESASQSGTTVTVRLPRSDAASYRPSPGQTDAANYEPTAEA